MALVRYLGEPAARPRSLQVEGNRHARANVSPTVDHQARNPCKLADVFEDVGIAKERMVTPVMEHERGDLESLAWVLPAGVGPGVWGERAVRVLPPTPCDRRAISLVRVGAGHAAIKRIDDPLPHRRDGRCGQLRPLSRKDVAEILRDPLDLGTARGRHGTQSEAGHSLWVRLSVSKSQGRAPGESDHDPSVDAGQLPQHFDIRHELLCCVVGERIGIVRGWRRASSTATLIEGNNGVDVGIKVRPVEAVQPGPRATM